MKQSEQVPTKDQLSLTPEQDARAREIIEDCRQMPRWAARQLVRLQDRAKELEQKVEQNDIEAAVEVARKSDWQPIETAPPTDRNNPVYVAYPRFNSANRTMVPDEYICFTAYRDNLGWDTGFWRLHEMPHYWHPLPSAPTTMRDGAQIIRPSMEAP